MCNLYSNTTAAQAMRQMFDVTAGLDRTGNAEPLPAIFPKHMAPVVRLTEEGREMLPLSWGFRTTNKSKKTGNLIMPSAWNNARADKLRSAGLWKDAFLNRRCLVPASSFCEARGRNPATYHWFALKGDDPRPPFAFAGMWTRSRYMTKDGPEECETYTIITTTANDVVRPVHPDRMPVILKPGDHATWLEADADAAFDLLEPYPAEEMHIVRSGEGEKSDPVD